MLDQVAKVRRDGLDIIPDSRTLAGLEPALFSISLLDKEGEVINMYGFPD